MIELNHDILLVAVITLVTLALRFAPFLLFPGGKKIPAPLLYLSRILPSAVMGMLIIYCLKNAAHLTWPFALPELSSIFVVATLQKLRHNTLLSILAGTALYMLLVQTIFAA